MNLAVLVDLADEYREYLSGSCGGPRRTAGIWWLNDQWTVHDNDIIYVVVVVTDSAV